MHFIFTEFPPVTAELNGVNQNESQHNPRSVNIPTQMHNGRRNEQVSEEEKNVRWGISRKEPKKRDR